jgi:hypothetical protein
MEAFSQQFLTEDLNTISSVEASNINKKDLQKRSFSQQLLAEDLNLEPSDVKNTVFLCKWRPIRPFTLQNWAIFVQPAQSIHNLYPNCTKTAPKEERRLKFEVHSLVIEYLPLE